MTDLDPEEFRRLGHAVVDWIARYRAGVAERPVQPDVDPGWVRARLPAALPDEPAPLEALLAELDRVVVPASTHWQHPGFFGYFPANAGLHSLLGDMLSGGLGAQGMLWSTSPAATEVEQVLLDGLAGALGLDPAYTFAGGGGGCIQDSASSAALVALLAALHRTSAGAWRETGVDGRERIYVTAETHSSLAKAVRVAGLGARALHVVDAAPGSLAMSPSALAEAMRRRRGGGPASGARLPDGGHDRHRCRRPGAGGRGDRAAARRLGARRRRVGRGRGDLPRAPGACSTGSSSSTRSAPTPTSGCSRRSTPHCCGCVTGEHFPTRCRSRRSTCATRRRSRGRWWTTGTGRSRSGAASAR